MAPAPRARVPRGKVITDVARKPSEHVLIDVEEDTQANGATQAFPAGVVNNEPTYFVS
jgi:metal transporter CNNM